MYRILFIFACLWANCSFGQTLHFVAIENLTEQEIGAIVLPKIYQKIGITVIVTQVPGLRAERQAVMGKVDGEVMRIYSYGDENPSLIRIPTPYFQLETMAFTKANSGILIKSKAELSNYSLAKIRGVKHTDIITDGFPNVADVDSAEALIKLLDQGLVDVALTNTIDGLRAIHHLNLENVVVPSSRVLANLELFHYLHRDHKNLVDKIDRVIREMRANGELEALIHQAMNQVVQ